MVSRRISNEGLAEILRKHTLWSWDEIGGERANLSGADLSGADLSGANLSRAFLSRAILSGANLSGADLSGADLSGADLSGANLDRADLFRAILSGANLFTADLSGANLDRADLFKADLSGANLYRTDLSGADLSGAVNLPYIPMACPGTGSFVGWKKVRGNLIVKLQIPEDARRSSATGRKCRCDKALVLAIETIEGDGGPEYAYSEYDPSFVYKVDNVVTVDDFDDNRFNECAPGIHFFINRQEAVQY